MKWESAESNVSPFLSIVLAAHNELPNLKQLIPSLLNQVYSNFEIIVVLDRSIDGSDKYLTGLKGDVSFLNIVSTPDGWDHKKFALTEGFGRASGEWVVLIDADCLPYSDQWLKSISREINEKRDILIGVSPMRSENSLISAYAQFEAFMTYFLYTSLGIICEPYMAVGRNMAIRKSFWKERNGYEPIKKVKGGDDDLFVQLNGSKKNTGLFLKRESLVFTDSKKTWHEYWKQKLRHYSVSSSYKKRTKFLLSTFHIIHLLSIMSLLFLSPTPFFPLIILFYLFIKWWSYRFVASKIGAGINYILFPFVDMVYAFITPILGIWSQLIKDIKWKN